MKRRAFALLALPAVLAACGGGSKVTGNQVASDAAASSCADSGYFILYRADNSKQTLWNCWVNGLEVCVTDEQGVATNATAEARLLFANKLGAGRPDCLTP